MTLAADLAYARTHTSASENFRYHNYGNIKASTEPLRWMEYDSPASGVVAVADWLRRSQRDHGTYTLAQMIERYSPAYDNPGKNLIGEASRRTGFKPSERLDMQNFEQLHKTVAAILAQEGAGPRVLQEAGINTDETPPSRNGPAADLPESASLRHVWQGGGGTAIQVKPHQWYETVLAPPKLPPTQPEENTNE